MISIEHPLYLLFGLLILIPILLYINYKKWVDTMIQRIAKSDNLKFVLFGVSLEGRKRRFILLLATSLLLVLALINIRMGSGTEVSDRKGLDVMVALDVSKSMLAKDVSPNRLEKSKVLIDQALQQLKNNRVGFIIFAGNAYLQVPITSDFNAVKMMLGTASPQAVPTQGTVLGEAIELARKSFNQETNKYKVLLLITDGEDHDEDALARAKLAADEGVQIFTVGVGSEEGGEVIDPVSNSPRLDENGQPIITRLNESMLNEISTIGNGKYFNLKNTGNTAQELKNAINALEKRNDGTVVFTHYKSYFQWFIIIALILLFLEGFTTLPLKSFRKK